MRDPQSTGKIFSSMVAWRMPAFSSSIVGVSPSRNLSSSHRRSRRPTSISCMRKASAFFCRSAGIGFDRVLRAHRLVVPEDRLHLDQIDDALEIRFCADRNLDAPPDARPAACGWCRVTCSKSAPALVHLVDEADARNLILVALPPDGLRLRLHAARRNRTAPPRRRARAANAPPRP